MNEANGMNINLGSLVQLGNLLSNLGQLNTLSMQSTTNTGNIVGNTMGTTASTDTTGDSSNPGPRGLSRDNGATRHKPGHHTLPSNSRSCEHATGTHVSNTDT